ncbi:MAG: PadR family transcriptional regulator [Candidatus Hodarchaeales archaeon]
MKNTKNSPILNENQLLILGISIPFEHTGISGQRIEQLINERDIREWTNIGFSSIYYILDQLEKKGLLKVTKENREQRGAPHKLYFISARGKNALKESINYYLGQRLTFRTFMVILSLFPVLSYKEALLHLQSYRKILEKSLITRIKPKFKELDNKQLPLHIWGIFNYSIHVMTVELDFLDKLITKYQLALQGKTSPFKNLINGKFK